MKGITWTVLCCAYSLGLLMTAIPGQVAGTPVSAIAPLMAGAGTAILLPWWWRTGPKAKVWLMAGGVAWLAVLYFQLQMPKPSVDDVSQVLMHSHTDSVYAEVHGVVTTAPRLTRSQRLQFQLEATEAKEAGEGKSLESVAGTVYVTVPLEQGKNLYPGQGVSVHGSLYRPKPASNPGGFNFQAYLARQGIFTGLSGTEVTPLQQASRPLLHHIRQTLGWVQWAVQQRILRSQTKGLGLPEGPLVSAMVMGRNGVDLDYDLRDQFTRSGLAHALAASGFQVSLLIGVIVTLTQSLSSKGRFWLGIGVVLLYIGLTGIQPAVLRAGLMGGSALFAMTAERKVKPLGSLLVAATLLLLFNPLWIWDLGFQFSFLATLGLLVTVPVLTQWLDWLPSAIAPLIAVPMAAYLWTLPLQLYAFGIVSPYSIPINLLTTPLITVVSIGGMISALAALIYPLAGSALAWLLHYPTAWLIAVAALGNQLPGSSLAVGTISAAQVFVLYGLFGLIWSQRRWWRYWWVAGVVGVSLVAIPAWHVYSTLSQMTVLATTGEPVLVVQDRGKVTLINSGNESSAIFTVLPFLKQAGINRINWAIAPQAHPASAAGWSRILMEIPAQIVYGDPDVSPTESKPSAYLPLPVNQAIALGSMQLQLIQANPPVLYFQHDNQSWLYIQYLDGAEQQHLVSTVSLPSAQVLWWSGGEVSPQILQQVHPDVAIASARSIPPRTAQWLQQHQVMAYSTGEDGAIQWTPEKGFRGLRTAD